MSGPVYDFKECLERSHAYSEQPWWESVYRQAFPSFQSMQCVIKDGWAQRGGIDRVVFLNSGKTILVDEKVLEKQWPHIALERWSDQRRKRPGWVQKDLACDFIAYAFAPTQRCYMLPFQTLRRTWVRNGKQWIAKAWKREDGFREILADNSTYTTECIGVPIQTLLDAVRDSMIADWCCQAMPIIDAQDGPLFAAHEPGQTEMDT